MPGAHRFPNLQVQVAQEEQRFAVKLDSPLAKGEVRLPEGNRWRSILTTFAFPIPIPIPEPEAKTDDPETKAEPEVKTEPATAMAEEASKPAAPVDTRTRAERIAQALAEDSPSGHSAWDLPALTFKTKVELLR